MVCRWLDGPAAMALPANATAIAMPTAPPAHRRSPTLVTVHPSLTRPVVAAEPTSARQVAFALRGTSQVLGPARLASTVVLGQQSLPEPDRLRRHLDQLVHRDELERAFEREVAGRRQPERLV